MKQIGKNTKEFIVIMGVNSLETMEIYNLCKIHNIMIYKDNLRFGELLKIEEGNFIEIMETGKSPIFINCYVFDKKEPYNTFITNSIYDNKSILFKFLEILRLEPTQEQVMIDNFTKYYLTGVNKNILPKDKIKELMKKHREAQGFRCCN